MARPVFFQKRGLLWILGDAFMAVRRCSRRLLHDISSDVTVDQAVILVILSVEGGLRLKDLAELSDRDRTTTTRMVEGLVRRNLVAKVRDRHDRRQKLISLTREGRKRLVGIGLLVAQIDCIALRGIPAGKQKAVCTVLKRVAENLNQE